MKTLLRVTLLGLFAAAGVGLAIGVGYSTPTSSTPTSSTSTFPGQLASEPAPQDVDKPSAAHPDEPLNEPPPLAEPAAAVLPGPVIARSHPVRAEQVVDQNVNAHLAMAVGQLAQRLAAAPLAVAAAAPPAAPPTAPPAPTTAAAADGTIVFNVPQGGDVREALQLLGEQANLNVLMTPAVTGNASAALSNVTIEEALQAILKANGLVAKRDGNFLYIGTMAEFGTLEQALDEIGTRIYRPNYVSAAELQQLITPLLSEVVGKISVSTQAEAGIATDDSTVGGDDFAGADAVVVRDYEAVLAEFDQMVDQLDVCPLQVAIEAMILSVKLSDENKFGVDFALLRENLDLWIGFPNLDSETITFESGGLNVAFLDGNVAAFLEALETVGDTNVIATPRLTVLNKHRAEIQIGEKLGYVSTTVTETASTQSVEFLDIGAQLRLRPFISSDGNIRMEVHPELSDGSVEEKGGFTLPNKEVTMVTTNIMVHDGRTVIIGGLIREQLVNTTTQVPLFGNLPLVGPAFRHTKETTERREVLVLITPRIVYQPEVGREGDGAASEFHRRQSVYRDKMSPLGKRAIGRRYFRLAQYAWAEGNRNRALRMAEMAVHFDPLNRAAIDLRSDVWQGNPYGNHTLGADAMSAATTATMVPSPMDGQIIDAWLLSDLEREPIVTPVPQHPLDPGQPGSRDVIERPRRFQ
ncbi:MAG: secretin and TonB N-terminal domain-containing protein [Candidatus Nealsonbacteria bacterium]|nr:secretin and TonB N-terminal domain-containing protein [Candidatus Nealsonbacteria bacterium]